MTNTLWPYPVAFGAFSPIAQSPSEPAGRGTVTGRIVCADTRQPARAARVTLIPAASGEHTSTGRGDKSSLTQLDGTFVFKGVSTGDYYLSAELVGYVDETMLIHDAVAKGGDALKTLGSLPRVHVSDGGGDIQFALQRGAVFTGTVTWEDGSPATGAAVEVSIVSSSRIPDLPSDPTEPNPGVFLSANQSFPVANTRTDDGGHFRLAGLPAGGYVVSATQRIPFKDGSLGDYHLQAFELQKSHAIDAPVRKLSAGEERDGVDIILSADGTYAVSGRVDAATAAVHSGEVVLRDKVDGRIGPTGQIQMDGTFTLSYVSPGTYDIIVTASSQTAQATRCCSFTPPDATLKQTVTVINADIVGLNLQVAHLTHHE